MGHKISKEQIDPGVKDHIMSFVGDVADLETEVNTDIISAVNSLMVDRVDNTENMGKLANAIGEPVTANHSVDEVVEGLGEMLSTFKTNMMNSGVVVESSDKFKALIDKIKGLTEGEGNKGIQYAEGTITVDSPFVITSSNPYTVSTNLDFTPSLIVVSFKSICSCSNITIDSITATPNNKLYLNLGLQTYDYFYSSYLWLSDVTAESFKIYGSTTYSYSIGSGDPTLIQSSPFTWYAIGIGEEDTTLRDSLASILEEEGVSVTEEDDMASLITKVDEEFDRKTNEMESNKGLDIISATELPATGNNMQLCAITDTISDSFILSNDEADVKISGTDIGIQLTELTMYDKYSYPMGGSTINLRIATTYQNASAIPLWLYYNNAWVQICSTKVIAINNKILQDGFTMGTTSSYGYYGETAGLVLRPGSSANLLGFTPFNNTIDFSKYKAIRIKGTYQNTTSSTGTYGPGIGIFGMSANFVSGTVSGAGYGLSDTTSVFDALFSYTKTFNSSVTTSTPFDFTFDISRTNTCYLGIVTAMTEYTYITDLEFILK